MIAEKARMSCARMRNIVRLLRRAGCLDDTAAHGATRAIELLVTIKDESVSRKDLAASTGRDSLDLVDSNADGAESPTIDAAIVRSMIAPQPLGSRDDELGLPSYPAGVLEPDVISAAECARP